MAEPIGKTEVKSANPVGIVPGVDRTEELNVAGQLSDDVMA